MAGSGADVLSAYTPFALEEARFESVEKCGAVLDIVKCYNAIPRWPLIALLARIGFPRPYNYCFR